MSSALDADLKVQLNPRAIGLTLLLSSIVWVQRP